VKKTNDKRTQTARKLTKISRKSLCFVFIKLYRNVGSVRHLLSRTRLDAVAAVQLQLLLLASSFLTVPTRPISARRSIQPLLSIFFTYPSKPSTTPSFCAGILSENGEHCVVFPDVEL